MRDNLKDYIQNGKDSFDVYPYEPDWKNLEKKLPSSRIERKKKVWISIAASLSGILISSIVYFYSQTSTNPLVLEFNEISSFYTQEINQQVSIIQNSPNGKEILSDLDAMDAAFAELKEDLKDNIDNEEVISALMDNYRLKLEILERIVSELEKEEFEQSL